jgi:hypothetical protein
MSVSEQELRTMIRESIARHASGAAPAGGTALEHHPHHASHIRLPVLRGADDDGACLIEPAVRCNHCGFCQSFGH